MVKLTTPDQTKLQQEVQPVLDVTCDYGTQCRLTTIASAHEVEVSSEEKEEELSLGALTLNKDSTWVVKLLLQEKEVQFKMVTGAEVTFISDKVLRSLSTIQLEKPTKVLCGPARQQLHVMGQYTGVLFHDKNAHTRRI